jgi:hypothetical protein
VSCPPADGQPGTKVVCSGLKRGSAKAHEFEFTTTSGSGTGLRAACGWADEIEFLRSWPTAPKREKLPALEK